MCHCADRIEAVRRELARYNINSSEAGTIQCLELLGEGTYGKVGRAACICIVSLEQQLMPAWLREADHTLLPWWCVIKGTVAVASCFSDFVEGYASCAKANMCMPTAANMQVYKGLWKGTVVAVKTIVLPAVMSGQEKREKMAIMEAAISSALSHPNIMQV